MDSQYGGGRRLLCCEGLEGSREALAFIVFERLTSLQYGPPRLASVRTPCRLVTYTLPFNMAVQVDEYLREDGTNPYKAWFDSLDAPAAAKVVTAKLRLELGNTSNVKWFDGIGEYVIDWGPGYRIYLASDGDRLIVLFGGGTKRCTRSTRPGRRLPLRP